MSSFADAVGQSNKLQTTPVENLVDIVSDGGSIPPASTTTTPSYTKWTSVIYLEGSYTF